MPYNAPLAKPSRSPSSTSAVGRMMYQLRADTALDKGGEGTMLLLKARDKPGLLPWVSGSYWIPTLFNLHGRAVPFTGMGLYLLYTTVVCVVDMQVSSTQKEDATSQLRQLGTVVSNMGTLLFLLVTFRNNAAFNRWQAGSDRFHAFCDKAQNLTRLAAGEVPRYMITNPAEAHDHAMHHIKWLMAAVEVARQKLRGVRNESALSHVVAGDDLAALLAAPDPVSYCLLRVGYKERSFRLDKDQKWFERADEVYNDFAACRSVLNSPIPFAYVAHLRTFMVLWLAAIPWTYVVFFGWYTMLLCAAIGYGVIGVEEAAVEVEQPFGDDFNDVPLDWVVSNTQEAMAANLRFVRDLRKQAVAAGLIEESSGSEEGDGQEDAADSKSSSPDLKGVVVAQS